MNKWINQKRREQRRAIIARETKEQRASKGFNFAVKKTSGQRNKPESTEATQSRARARCQQTSVSNIRTKGPQAAGLKGR